VVQSIAGEKKKKKKKEKKRKKKKKKKGWRPGDELSIVHVPAGT
jgi:hypothetical protein